jgi:hypothetical protein
MEVASLVIGFLLGLVPGWVARGRRLRGHWGALGAELELCEDRGQALLTHHVGAPLYRFPTMAYEASLPILLAEADVSEDEAMVLGRFYCQVQDINRGLDNAAAVIMDTQRLEQEFQRNVLKCRDLIEGEQSLYGAAREIVDRKVATPWWRTAP